MARTLTTLEPYLPYGLVTLLVLGPLLLPGYILTLDMVFTPVMPMPEHLTSSYPLFALLHWLSLLLPNHIVQKILLVGIMLGCCIGMHRLIRLLQVDNPHQTPWGIAIGSILFAINPFTYDRLMAGQYTILLGYALLPWILSAYLRFCKKPTIRRAAYVGIWLAILGVMSVHITAAALLVLTAMSVVGLWQHRKQRERGLGSVRLGLVGVAVFVVLSGFWLVPLLAGQGRTAETITRFTQADIAAFATTGDTPVIQLLHVVSLQGFWGESRNLFVLPQHQLPVWWGAVVLLWGLVITGVIILWRSHPTFVWGLVLSMAIATMLALGVPIAQLADAFPNVAGFREPQKFVAVLALGYAIFAAYGIDALLRRFYVRSEAAYNAGTFVILMLPLVLTFSMFLGAMGQLRPRQYPADWASMDHRLNSDTDNFAVLFLPWHQYMSYGFSQRIIASPAQPYFTKPMIVSDDPELQGAIATTATAQTAAIGKLLADPDKQFSQKLADHNIKYVLLAKEYDYRDYRYLNTQSGLEPAAESATLKLYRNTTWRHP